MPGENTVFCGIDIFLSFGRAGCRPTPSKSPTREYAHVFAWYYSVLQLARLGNWFESNLLPSFPPGIDSQTAQRCGLRPACRRVGRTVRLPRTMATSHDHLQRTTATAHGNRGPTVRLQRMIANCTVRLRCGCSARSAAPWHGATQVGYRVRLRYSCTGQSVGYSVGTEHHVTHRT